MFGYVTVNADELKVKDYKKYKSYYCGLCQVLKEEYGFSGQMTLTYDMTFAVIFLTSLYESTVKKELHRCKVHPVKKQAILRSEMTAYAADMNILLAWYHLEDDWEDEKKIPSLLAKGILKRKAEKIIEKYPRQSKVIAAKLKELSTLEKEGCTDLDQVSGCFGELMAELFVYKKDIWEESLRKIGFYLGKYIYLMDAYDDLEEDKKKGCYNPLKELSEREGYEEQIREILGMMIAECAAWFERLPCLLDVEILRNILYDGVWNRYRAIQKKQMEGKEQKNV